VIRLSGSEEERGKERDKPKHERTIIPHAISSSHLVFEIQKTKQRKRRCL